MYPLTMQEKAVLIRDFFNGVALKDISRTFFLSYHKPLSAPTIYRCIVRSGSGLWNAVQRYTIENWSERIEVGRIWEGDGTPLTADKWLLIVKDDKANMVLSRVFDRSENAKSVKKLLNAAKKIYGEPERFRCDGSRAFISAASRCFSKKVIIEVHARIGRTGQNQSIEALFSDLKLFLAKKRGIHAQNFENIEAIIDCWLLHHNFVKPSPSRGAIPSVIAGVVWLSHLSSIKNLPSKNVWEDLLQIKSSFLLKTKRKSEGQGNALQKYEQVTLDHYLNTHVRPTVSMLNIPHEHSNNLTLYGQTVV